MSEQLFRKVVKGKKTTYELVPMESAKLDEGMTANEIVTAVATLGVLCINGYHRMLEPKSCSANRVKGVEEAVLKMFRDTGATIDQATTVQVCQVWNRTMLTLDGLSQ